MRINTEAAVTLRLLSNPAAFRIVATLAARGQQTTEEIARALDDVAVSTLYRQLTALREAGIAKVVAERRARGTVERTYALESGQTAAFTSDEIAAMPLPQLRAAIRNFVASLVASVTAYIASKSFRQRASQTQLMMAACELTDDDYTQALREMRSAISSAKERSKNKKHTARRSFYVVALPDSKNL